MTVLCNRAALGVNKTHFEKKRRSYHLDLHPVKHIMRRWPLKLERTFDSSVMDTALSVGLQHASFNFTRYRSCRI
jgi:hypothetical protein